MVLTTGEDIPRSEGLRSRCFFVPVDTNSVDVDILTVAQEMAGAGFFEADMIDYIGWLASQMDDIKQNLRGEFIGLRNAYRKTLGSKGHARTPANVAPGSF